jgi:chemotaxis signal transduction protein
VTGTASDHALLAARAAELARPFDAPQEDGVDLLVLVVSDQRVALPVEAVRAVRSPGPVARVPAGGSALVGMIGEQGEALPVAPLAALLGLPPDAATDQQWVVVLDHPAEPVGLLADLAVDIVSVRQADITSAVEPGGLTTGLLADGTVLLDPGAVLHDPRLTVAPSDPTKELQ